MSSIFTVHRQPYGEVMNPISADGVRFHDKNGDITEVRMIDGMVNIHVGGVTVSAEHLEDLMRQMFERGEHPPAEAQARPVEWMREWQGSGPQRGFHIREATRLHNNRVVAYLGDQVDSGEVDRLIAEHNGKHPNGEPLRPAEAQPVAPTATQGGGEVVAWAARNRSTGKFGYIWHTQDDVRGWIDLQHQSSDACTWTGPIPLYSTPAVQGFDAALQEIAESGDRCTSGDGHARCIDIATRALAAAAKGVGNG